MYLLYLNDTFRLNVYYLIYVLVFNITLKYCKVFKSMANKEKKVGEESTISYKLPTNGLGSRFFFSSNKAQSKIRESLAVISIRI